MKISDATLIVTSRNSSEQMDVMLKQASRTKGTASGSSRPLSLGAGTDLLPTMVVDRVSISQETRVEFQSGYTANMASRSVVQSPEGGEARVFEQDKMVETLVGGVIDRAVVVRRLGQGEDITIDTGQDTAKRTMEGRSVSSGTGSGGTQVSVKQTDIHFEQAQMVFASKGEVVTEDGRTIGFSLDIAMDRAVLSRTEQETLVRTWKERVILTDPLVISLDGGLPQVSDASFAFDLDNDGTTENISFASPGSGFLAFDRNNDHKINNGSELFGPGTGNGFGELAAWDKDNNGWIDENDAVFSQLSVWTKDEQGQDRLMSLKDAGIGAIFLENAATSFDLADPTNTLKGRLKSSGLFLFENGNVGSIQQIDLAARPIETDTGKEPLSVNTPFPRGNTAVPGPSSPAVFQNRTGPVAGQSPQNPLESLLEQVRAMREKMNQILGETVSPHGNETVFTTRWKKNGLARSNYQSYLRTDPFVLISDRKRSMNTTGA